MDHRYIFLGAKFNPRDNNIVHLVYTDEKETLPWYHYRVLTVNLLTNDTFTAVLTVSSGGIRIDENDWMYYRDHDQNIWKCKTNGSGLTQLTFNYESFFVDAAYDGSELLFNKDGIWLYFSDNSGVVHSSEKSSDYIPYADAGLLAISSDFNYLLFSSLQADSCFFVERATKKIVRSFPQRMENPNISRDNKKIVWVQSPPSSISIMDIETLSQTRIKFPNGQYCPNHQYKYPVFSNDGKYIMVQWRETRRMDSVMGVPYIGVYTSIMDVQGKNERRFIPGYY